MRATWLFVALATAAMVLTTFTTGSRVQAQATAQAEAEPGDAAELDRAARALFEAGKIAFDLGRYEEALDHLTQAFNLSKRPLLLFNIASTLDRLRRDAEALDAFERYLREVPDAPNRPAVEGRVRLLREAVERAKTEEAARAAAAEQQRQAEAAAQQNQTPAQTTPEQDPQILMVSDASDGGGLSPVIFIVGASLTVVGGVVATISGINTLDARDQYEEYAQRDDAEYEVAKDLYDDGVARQTRTNVFIGLTAALAVGTTVIALLTDWGGGDDEPQVGAAGYVSADGGGLSLRGSF